MKSCFLACSTGKLKYKHECTWQEEATGELKTVFKDGKLLVDDSLQMIRERIRNSLTLLYCAKQKYCPVKEAALVIIVVSLPCTAYHCGSLIVFWENTEMTLRVAMLKSLCMNVSNCEMNIGYRRIM